jgi:HAD superfamily hydrolase (TIGR01509 family)
VIRAICFDLDGTLVETEYLKARSYADTVAELLPGTVADDVVAAYGDLAGAARETIAAALVARFAVPVSEARFLDMRLARYDAALADHALVRRQGYAPTIALLRALRAEGWRTGMATMSYGDQARGVLAVLGLADAFDAVVTREEVSAPKPDPEIYAALAARLALPPSECLAVEDSVPGVRAALAAGMRCVAAATALTRASLRAAALLPPGLVVDDPVDLAPVVRGLLASAGPGA